MTPNTADPIDTLNVNLFYNLTFFNNDFFNVILHKQETRRFADGTDGLDGLTVSSSQTCSNL